MLFKVAFIGAGSVGFTRTLFTDLIPPKNYKGIRVHEKTVEEMRANKEEARKNAAEADKAQERPSAKE